MSPTPKYFIVEATALPDIFLKVAEAKRILELREADTVNEATLKVGISRSAFYKYKDAIRPFNDMLNGHIVTFQVLLKDEPGVLSSILASFAASGGNILTINQSIPHRRRGSGHPVGGDLQSDHHLGRTGSQCGTSLRGHHLRGAGRLTAS